MNIEFESYAEQLKSYLYRLTANNEDAEDLLHDTFIKAQEKIETFKGNSSLKTWVFSIATNLAKDNQRVKNRCAMINKTGVCYQCAELNDYLQTEKNSTEKISKLGLSRDKSPEENLKLRFQIINQINPLNSNGADLEDTIMQILRETINDQ